MTSMVDYCLGTTLSISIMGTNGGFAPPPAIYFERRCGVFKPGLP
ncbi:MAG TPA: hypothetical protein VGO68_11010 [Pyrinomonadaceae bacterium]|nr:hypothetical protein [Pyrinomonadaceae bacterium]